MDINDLLKLSVERGASDLHLKPEGNGDSSEIVRF
jgi:Tfp pilus assembly pilus retraction ATPase PilT|tara:strand:+ start:2607 stop:2711 length:105 start_codon:yes stop_codon:yes gene_type:complete